MRKFLPILTFVTACGSAHHGGSLQMQPNEPQKDPAYYAAEYEAIAKSYLGQDFTITTNVEVVDQLDDTTDGAIGACYPDTNKIELQKSNWDSSNGVERKELLFHELAHCNQYRPHLDTTRSNGKPASIMNGNALPDWITFQTNEEYYETELFSVTETCGQGDALPCRLPG